MNINIKFWQGTNFWIALTLAIGGLFVGFPADDARLLIGSLFATITGAALVREKVKGLERVDWKTWLKSPNTWNYIAAFVTAIIPTIPAQLFTDLRSLIDALLGGNWQGIAIAIFSIANMLYYIIKGNVQIAKVAKS